MSTTGPIVEQKEMGRVTAEALIENLKDLREVERGLRKPEESRCPQLTDARVDTGATTLALPTQYIKKLGLSKTRESDSVSAHG